MALAIETGSGFMKYIPSFIKFGSDIQTLIGGGGRRYRGDAISLVLFLNKKMG
jgi:hypothetical protein